MFLLFESRICHCLINKISNIIEFWTGASVSWQHLVPVSWNAHVWDPATMPRINQGAHRANQVKMNWGPLPSGPAELPAKRNTTLQTTGVSSIAQMVRNLPAMQETRIRSLGQENPLEKVMATHSSILAWRIPWTEEPGGSQRVGHDWVTNTFTFNL